MMSLGHQDWKPVVINGGNAHLISKYNNDKKSKENNDLKPLVEKKYQERRPATVKSAPPVEKKRKLVDEDGPSGFTDDDLPAFLQRR